MLWKSRIALWDRCQISEGLTLVEEALRLPGRPQSYAVQAAIAAHACAGTEYKDTDWPQIAGLYEVLLRISPSPVIELNHAAWCRWSMGRRGRWI